MKDTITININKFKKARQVTCDGKSLTFYRMGAGTELELSINRRRQLELLSSLLEIKSKYDTGKIKQSDYKKIVEKSEAMLAEIEKLRLAEVDIYKSLVNDKNNGKDVDALINSLSIEGIKDLFNDVFAEG